MKRGLATIFAVVALGGLCVVLLSRLGDRRGGTLEAAEPAVRDARGVPAPGAVDPPAEPSSAAQRDVVPVSSVAPAAPEVEAFAAEPPPANGLEILVRMRDTKEPVPRAKVSYLEWEELDPSQSFEFSSGRRWEAVARFGRTFAAGADGVVIVPRPRGMAYACASLPGSFATLQPHPEDTGRLVLELVPDRALRVRVVDARGAPVGGQAVALRAQRGQLSQDALVAFSRPEDGLAVLEHVQVAAAEQRGLPLAAALVLLGRTPVQTRIDPAALPLEPLELTLPECGALEVFVDRSDGAPADVPVHLRIARTRTSVDADVGASWFLRVVRGGRELVGGVELGLDLQLSATTVQLGSANRAVAGPRQSGEVVSVHVALPAAQARTVAGRALREDRTPLGGVPLRASVVHERDPGSGPSAGSAATVETDGEGRFHLPVPASKPQGVVRTSLSLATEDALGARLQGSVPLDLAALQGETDLGDVFLSATPLLAAGRVVDELGQGIGGAVVTLAASSPEDEMRTMRLRAIGYGGSETSAATDATGAFELRGGENGSTFELTAEHADYASPEPLEVARGARQVVLVLRASGRIAGRLLLDPAVPFRTVQVVALDSRGERAGAPTPVLQDGRFEVRGLRAGLYGIVPLLREEDEELARVDGIAAQPLETREDPRLDPLDLRGKIQRFVLTVQDREGKRVRWFQVRRRPAGDAAFGQPSYAGWREDFAVCTSRGAVDLRIWSDDYRLLELDGVSGDQTVTLRGGIPVEVVLSEELRRFASAHEVDVYLQSPSDEEIQSGTSLGSEGRGTLQVAEPGRHKVLLYVETDDEPVPLGEGLGLAVDVADSDVLQTFTISVPAEEIEKARGALEGK